MDSNCMKVDLENDSMDIEDEVESVDIEDKKNDIGDKKAGTKRQRKERSIVWKYFTKLQPKPIDGKTLCKCNKCKHVFTYYSKQGTGNFKRHLESCIGNSYQDVGQMIFNSDMKLRSSNFDENKFRDMLVAAIVMHELPLSFVDYKGIRDLFTYLQPNVKVISRNTVRSDLLKMYKKEKENVKNMLMESPGMLCLTSDLWTSIATDGYLAITVHFVDKQWVLQKRVLSFSFMPPPHTGVALCEKVFSILVEWGIEKKIFCVTLDNASSNDTFVGLLREQLNTKSPLVSNGRFFHLRCCAHILNLIVQDGLKKIEECVKKVRESIKYVKGSQGRKQKFLDCVKLLSLNSKKGLRQDVPTRWNSTFLMLDSAIYFRRAFCHLEMSDSNYKNCPNRSEWDTIEKISGFLGVFHEVTNVFSGTKYPTANLYYPHIFVAYLTLYESKSSADEYIRKMAELMMSKFQKYWSEFSLILAMAVVLDPRYKLQFIDWSYSKVYGADNTEYENVDQFVHSTFNEYAMLNVANEFRYPTLARMARDFLTIPISTVASESTFSASGRVLDQHRSSLSKDTIEALICTKDWLFADCCSNEVDLNELTEDITLLDIHDESDASNSVNNSKV